MKSFLRCAVAILPLVSALPFGITKRDDTTVPGKYIVTLKPDVKVPEISSHVGWVGEVHARSLEARNKDGKNREKKAKNGVEKVWQGSFKGYSGEFDEETIVEIADSDDVSLSRISSFRIGRLLRLLFQVLDIEPVQVIDLYRTVTQTPAPWGLGSISHRTPNWGEYLYQDSAGSGTWAYVLDTGIHIGHQEFQGRAYLGYNAIPGVNFTDINGHGTHVAGTIASRLYGVAKKANLMAVKVFDSGSVRSRRVVRPASLNKC